MASVLGEESAGNLEPYGSLGRVQAVGWNSVASAGLDLGSGQRDPEAAGVSHLGKGWGGTQSGFALRWTWILCCVWFEMPQDTQGKGWGQVAVGGGTPEEVGTRVRGKGWVGPDGVRGKGVLAQPGPTWGRRGRGSAKNSEGSG